MQPLLDLLAVHGVAAEDAIISGERRLRFAEQKTATLSGVLCDSYEPYISALSVGTADGVCVPLPPDGPDFSALAAALPKIKSLPLYEILQEPGSPPPDRVGSFSITAPAFLALVKA